MLHYPDIAFQLHLATDLPIGRHTLRCCLYDVDLRLDRRPSRLVLWLIVLLPSYDCNLLTFSNISGISTSTARLSVVSTTCGVTLRLGSTGVMGFYRLQMSISTAGMLPSDCLSDSFEGILSFLSISSIPGVMCDLASQHVAPIFLQIILQIIFIMIRKNSGPIRSDYSQFMNGSVSGGDCNEHLKTFDECMQLAGLSHRYQRMMVMVFAPYWLIASLFLFQQVYTFQQPHYNCQDESLTQAQCQAFVCDKSQHHFDPSKDITRQHSLTEDFGLYCRSQPIRILYKLCPHVLSFIGYLIYGYIGDFKGRLVAAKISWRIFIVGLLFFSLSRIQVLCTFGYIVASINCMPTLLLQLTLLFQLANKEWRSYSCLVLLASYGIGEFAVGLVAQPLINSTGPRIMILILCFVPTFICGLWLNQLTQSPRFVYGRNKIKALNLLNNLAQKNKKQRLILDLARSRWVENYRPIESISYREGFYFDRIRRRMIIGIVLTFTVQFTSVAAQIYLDRYLSAYWRGGVISLTGSVSFLILGLFINKIKRNITKNLALAAFIQLILGLLMIFINQEHLFVPTLIASIILKSVSCMSFGILLIWAVQTFPTMFRMMGSSFVLIGWSLSGIIPYFLRQDVFVIVWIAVGLNVISIPFSVRMPDSSTHQLTDDLTYKPYGQRDYFYRY